MRYGIERIGVSRSHVIRLQRFHIIKLRCYPQTTFRDFIQYVVTNNISLVIAVLV